ncbi:MAG: CesT family type III secretion system chaperone [Rhabdochlamydiaceae bacterium]|nr:CesT family type III secretion system chaperone [Candidatus Amphrikana amoebophyrae]
MAHEVDIEQYLENLQTEVGVEKLFEKKERNTFFLPFGQRNILIFVSENNLLLTANLGLLPTEEEFIEPFCIHLLFANYLGQGSGSSGIGLSPDKQTITLTMDVRGDIDYRIFKEQMEEFVNYLDYWINEIEQKKIRDLK